MLFGNADSAVMDGGGIIAPTATVADDGPLDPPAPVQVNVYVTLPAVVSGPTETLAPETATVPFQPSVPVPPVAVQDEASLVAHVSAIESPAWTEGGVAEKFTMF